MPEVPLIDIRPDHWKIVCGILYKHVPQYEVWAFGSRAKWTAKPYSDLDLAVISGKPLSLSVSASLADDFSESDLPWKVDVVDWSTTSESFRKIIQRDKVVVQEAGRGGGMANEWAEDRFGSLVRFVSEKSQAKDANINTYVSTENMLADFGGITSASALPLNGSVTRFKIGDTLFSNIRTYFKKVWQAKFDGCCSNDVLVFRSANTETLLPDYLHQISRWEKFTELSIRTSKGAKMPRGDKDALANFKFKIPPVEEQRAIAHILGALDDKIELNRRMNATLEAMARTLFQSWFVDFDPVRAKMEGRDPGLPKAITDLFPDSFDESELGEIPKGWQIKSIGDLADIAGGTTPSTKEPAYWEGGTQAWATPKDLSGLSVPVLLDTERRITDAGLSQIGSGLLPKGTVLLSSRAPIGYLAVAELPVAINQGFIAMLPKAGTSNLFLLLWASVAHEDIVSRANGSTFLEISKTNFRPIPVVTPSAGVMQGFEQLVRPLYERIVECAHESRTLATLRDTLLPKLLSRQITTGQTPL